MTDGGRPTRACACLSLGLIVISVAVPGAARAQDVPGAARAGVPGTARAQDAPGAARAQEGFRLIPSISTTEVHESNLFSTPVDPQADFIMRVTPGIASEHRSTVWTLTGRYSLDVERFANHPALTTTDARQHGILGVEYRPTRRLALDADAEISKTRAPGELNADTSLAYTRARAGRTTLHSSMTHHLSAITSGTIEYTFSQDRVVGAADTRTHTARVGADRRWSARDEVSVDYRLQQMFFGLAGSPASMATSHALSFGWNHSINRLASLAIAGGPRVTNGSLAPDLAAAVQYHRRPIELSLAYARTQATVIGLAGTTDTQSATTTTAWRLRRSLQITVSPAFLRSRQGALHADVYRVALDASHPIGRGLSAAFALAANTQKGNLYARLANQTIQQRTIMIKLIAEPGVRRH